MFFPTRGVPTLPSLTPAEVPSLPRQPASSLNNPAAKDELEEIPAPFLPAVLAGETKMPTANQSDPVLGAQGLPSKVRSFLPHFKEHL